MPLTQPDKGGADTEGNDHANRPNPRQLVLETAEFYYSGRAKMSYSQSRPIPTIAGNIRPPKLPKSLDCSGFAITCYWQNGLAHYLGAENSHGAGYTGSLIKYGKKIKLENARAGDLLFYDHVQNGRVVAVNSHVALVAGKNLMYSFGHAPMGRYTFDYAPGVLRINQCRSYLP